MSIKELFKDFPNSAQKFYEWCKNNDELCDYDLEKLEIDLFCELTMQNTFQKYIYLNNGMLFDWLEDMEVYITYKIKMKPSPKFISVVYKSGSNYPIYSNKGVESREKALFHGFRNAIKYIENE